MYKYWLVIGIDWYNMFLAFDWQRFVCNIFSTRLTRQASLALKFHLLRRKKNTFSATISSLKVEIFFDFALGAQR